MPDFYPSSSNDSRNLPVVIAQPGDAPAAGDHWLLKLARSLFGWKPVSVRASLEDLLATNTVGTGFSPAESKLLQNILKLRERRVEDVMIPRADIIAVQQDISLGELLKVFSNAAHSRLVVYDETLDDASAMVHIRDLIAFMTSRAETGAKSNTKRKKPFPAGLDLKAIDLSMALAQAKIMRAMLFVPPSMSAMDLLTKMQASHIHLALVVDEYGGADGIVSIEDIVEEIVGEIADEHDEEMAANVIAQPDGSYLADARASLEDIVSIVGPEFDVGEAAEEVDTIGGYLMTQIERVPVRGELVPGPGRFEIEVLDADPRRVKRLKIYRTNEPKTVGAARSLAARGANAAAPSSTTTDQPAIGAQDRSSSTAPRS